MAIQFGFPSSGFLLCDHPVCTELATRMIEVSARANATERVNDNGFREVYGCEAHYEAMLTGLRVRARHKLVKPGFPNETAKTK